MKKLLSILLAFLFLLPFTFAKTEAKQVSAEKFNAEINYIAPANYVEAEFLMDLDNNPSYYPYTPVAGDLCVFADGTTTGTYKCAQYNTSWHDGAVVEKTIAQLQTALANGTHVAVFGNMYHVHGLETADTSDDVYYDQILTSAGGNLDGNYYLTEDITLENDILIDTEIYVHIDLCGHVINVNNHQIINKANLTIESCKDTAHKFTTNSNGTYTWNETSGNITFNGGIITGNFTATKNRRNVIYSEDYLEMNSVSVIGFHIEVGSDLLQENIGFYEISVIQNESCLNLKKFNLLGNEGAYNYVTNFIDCSSDSIVGIGDFVAKNNISVRNGAVIYAHGTDFEMSNVIMTNNKCLEGAMAVYSSSNVYLLGKIVIDDNLSSSGAECNICVDGSMFYLYEPIPLQSDSSIGFSYLGSIEEGTYINVVDVTGYTKEYKSCFSSDSSANCLGFTDEYISLQNIIDEQPTSSNGYEFVLNDNATTGHNVSYQWYTCSIEEIAPKTGSTQNYVSTKYKFHNMYDIDSIFEDGYWSFGKDTVMVGVVVDLKAGDVLYVQSIDDEGTFLCSAPDHLADPNKYAESKDTYFIIQNDGQYSINNFSNFKLYVLHISDQVAGQTTNTLTITDPGNYACIATFTKQGKKISTITSNIAKVNGLSVAFSVPDSTIYVPTTNFIKNGSTIARPEDPSSIKVLGWYKEPELINEWDFANDVVTEDITLYAKYELDIDISVKMILVNQAKADCIVTVGEGLQLTLDNFYSFTFNGTTYLKSELDFIDPLDETKGYTNGTFTIEEGCIKITLPQDYINTFGLGTYDLSVGLTGMFNGENVDGMILSGSVQVVDKLPGTGVETNNSLFELVALTSIACAACYIVLQKKHN